MESDYPILPTTHGYIKGIKLTTVYDVNYYSFEGIPYAAAPLGNLRFKAPQPIKSWSNILDCTKSANKPLQKDITRGHVSGNEDCLYLNVYVKNLNSDKLLPVMIYIYGGAFQMGEATRKALGPDYFMEKDIILVTMNYRLDALGFLTFNDPELEIPGNAALKDQIAALKWFNNNCLNFNGDPNNITLFGESAGAFAAHYLAITEATKGLFHKFILMSGTVYNRWATEPKSDIAYRLAQINGYNGANNDRDVYEFLIKIDAKNLIGQNLVSAEEILNDIAYAFGPTIEMYESDFCVIPQNPRDMLKNAWSNNIPMMIGGTSCEGLIRYMKFKRNSSLLNDLKARPEYFVPLDAKIDLSVEQARHLGEEILKQHLGDNDLEWKNILNVIDIYSFRAFWHSFHRTVLTRLEYALPNVSNFLYRFDFDSPDFNHYRKLFCGDDFKNGVAHADDLSYLFYGKMAWKLSKDSLEYQTIKRMIGIWTAFAFNSNPNCKEIEEVTWLPVSKEEPNKALNINENVEFIDLPESKKLEFWNSLYSKNLY